MTDRLHSCKESPDGKHHWTIEEEHDSRLRLIYRFDGCQYCRMPDHGSDPRVFPVGWNVPAIDPDAPLGATEHEAFWQDLGRP